jgi:antitoxin component of MazEF toxin-antitoxin module
MRKNLSAIGNSLGLVIEKPILELLGITRDTELEISTDGRRLIVEPVRAPVEKRKPPRSAPPESAGATEGRHASSSRKQQNG